MAFFRLSLLLCHIVILHSVCNDFCKERGSHDLFFPFYCTIICHLLGSRRILHLVYIQIEPYLFQQHSNIRKLYHSCFEFKNTHSERLETKRDFRRLSETFGDLRRPSETFGDSKRRICNTRKKWCK